MLVREHLFGNSMNAYNTSFVDVRDVALLLLTSLLLTSYFLLPFATWQVRDVAAAASAGLTSDQAGGKRFIVTGDEGPMSTLDLGPIAQRALPQYRIGVCTSYFLPLTPCFLPLTPYFLLLTCSPARSYLPSRSIFTGQPIFERPQWMPMYAKRVAHMPWTTAV